MTPAVGRNADGMAFPGHRQINELAAHEKRF
jgi:hypothetical protein